MIPLFGELLWVHDDFEVENSFRTIFSQENPTTQGIVSCLSIIVTDVSSNS